MTSKEAVLELICEAKSVNIDEGRICFLRNIIEKDLEVLEILKRHSTRLDDEDWNNNIFNGIDYENLDEKERKIIKEWIKNDN